MEHVPLVEASANTKPPICNYLRRLTEPTRFVLSTSPDPPRRARRSVVMKVASPARQPRGRNAGGIMIALDELDVPPGNRLEALQGDWAGYHSIRVSDQWRVCFRWENGVYDVGIVAYH
jgi:hypothetical protein